VQKLREQHPNWRFERRVAHAAADRTADPAEWAAYKAEPDVGECIILRECHRVAAKVEDAARPELLFGGG